MKNTKGKFLVKINSELWDSFRVSNRKAGFGVSVNQRVNFWIEHCDLEGLDKAKFKGGLKKHHWVLDLYDLESYDRFRAKCKERGLSANKVINLLIGEFVEKGSVCTVNRFKV